MKRWFILAGLILAGGISWGESASNNDCLACHGERTFTTERAGKTIPLFVDPKKLEGSVHQTLACVSCHRDLEGKDLPHTEQPGPARCDTCHAAVRDQFADSLHGKALARGDALAPRCQSCHGGHYILPVQHLQSSVGPMRVPYVCGSCHREGGPAQRQREIHQSKIIENYSESIHGEGLLKKGLRVSANCVSCHTAHQILPHTDARSTIARANVSQTCMKCHSLIENVHRKVIKGELWEKQANVIPVCVECHQPHKVRKVFYDQGMSDRDCLRCHEKGSLKASSDGRSLSVKADELHDSVHLKTACAQCHTGATPSKNRPCETIVKKVECGVCHTAQVEQYATSTHGRLTQQGDKNAPSCRDCHGTHHVLSRKEARSPTFPINVPNLCGDCHREGEKAALKYQGKEKGMVNHYLESIHGKGLKKSGLTVTAMCTNCHTAHHVLPASDPQSSVHPERVPATCAQCHHGIFEQFEKSVHSPTRTKTDKPLPTCKYCHTAHTIRRTDEAGFKLEIMAHCGDCHVEIAKTYFETFHGKVTQLGYAKTAKCHDCHGAHSVRRVDDPDSSLSRRNVVQTCQKCHPGATRRFAGYLTHATHHDPKKYPWLFAVFWGMTILLVSTFIMGGLHTLLWLPRALQMRRKHPPQSSPPGEKHVVRFTRLNRILHVVMIVSFMSLAATGMTLKFSYTGWAKVLSHLLGGFEVAGYIHRTFAVVMFGLFATHLIDLVRLKRTQYHSWMTLVFGPDSLMLNRNDLRQMVGSLKWFLGLGERPRFGRWTYWEKFDYLAVFWGVAIIGSTGLMLWFPEWFTRILPGWLINIATIIHSDEALLATGFIFTIHFFNTHFRPDKFPMDIVIFTGHLSVEEFRRDKPAEYEALVASGELERSLRDPLPPVVIKAIRVFGWIALTIGLSLVVGIIYAMVFDYR